MGDVKTTLTWLLRDQVSGTAKQIDGSLGKLGVKTKNTGANMGILAGTMLAAGVVAVGLVKKFADEEVGVARLGASLKANVKDWDGNTDAIERTIAKREELAFSDDDLRESLALLVGATHNVSEAWELQTTAMDLARFKGIDLKTASEALIKIEGGQFRALKALIGSTSDITTKEQALAAVRKVAAGQADAYATTTQGKLERLSIAWEDVQENAGEALVNIGDGWGTLMDRLASAAGLTDAVKTTGGLVTELKKATVATGNLGGAMGGITTAAIQMQKHKWGLFLHGQAIAASGGGVLDGVANAMQTIFNATKPLADLGHQAGTAARGSGQNQGARASGGPVSAGSTYTVGENGPETLVMGGNSGTVVPSGGMGVGIVGVSAAQMADMIDRELYFRFKRTGLTQRRV